MICGCDTVPKLHRHAHAKMYRRYVRVRPDRRDSQDFWPCSLSHTDCTGRCAKIVIDAVLHVRTEIGHGIHLYAHDLAHSSFHPYTPTEVCFGCNKQKRSAWGLIRYGHIMGHLHVAPSSQPATRTAAHIALLTPTHCYAAAVVAAATLAVTQANAHRFPRSKRRPHRRAMAVPALPALRRPPSSSPEDSGRISEIQISCDAHLFLRNGSCRQERGGREGVVAPAGAAAQRAAPRSAGGLGCARSIARLGLLVGSSAVCSRRPHGSTRSGLP